MIAISHLLQTQLPSLCTLSTHHHHYHHHYLSRFLTSTSLSLVLHTSHQQPPPLHHDPVNNNNPVAETQKTEELISLIKSCTHKTHLLQIHAHIIRTSLIHHPIIALYFLARSALPPSPCRELSYSRQFFSQISNPSVSQYNAMIRAYSMSKSPENGVHMYREMRREGVPPNPLSSSFVLKCCAKFSSFIGGVQIHAMFLRDGHQSDSLLLTTLMDLYSGCEKFDYACKVFDEIQERDTVAWNVLISCYIRNNRTRDALCVFDAMQNSSGGCKPDNVTCLLLLQACANLGALDYGDKIHNYIKEQGYGDAVNLCNTLIVMYSKNGCLDKAYSVFKDMSGKNVVSWSAMISGFAMNGRGREAIEAFTEMQRMGVVPDELTLTGVLSACSHAGLVDEGYMVFERMSKEFGIVPNVHHYGCMVDLLGRAGLLDRAYQLMMSMGGKPDATMWRTLLGACRIHGHVTLGECVIEHLIELKAQEAGDYVLLLNMYSSVGNWVKVMELRKFMKEKSIQTTPGCSTIELKGKVHEFVVDDISHPRKDEIYEKLVEIGKQLKIAGYVAEISSELHNLCKEEKGIRLSYHSEKLAMAFGVLSTPPGTKIRVAKNLRTCVDCHNFAKYLSGVYNREVIIRDRTRFHHFREGRCSCNDYW